MTSDRDYASALSRLERGRRVVAATLVDVDGSAPFEQGATMLVDDAGEIEGSVTGGCVEAALVQEAQEVLGGGPARLVTYGVSDEQAADVGLTCGGTVRVLVHELDPACRPALETVRDAVAAGRPVAVARRLDATGRHHLLAVTEDAATGALGDEPATGGAEGPGLAAAVARDALGALEQAASGIRHYGRRGSTLEDEVAIHLHVLAAAPQLVICGAIDYSAAVARLARELGYRVTLCDARSAFLSSPRFSAAHEVSAERPDRLIEGRALGRRDAVLVFTHDPKFDVPAVRAALRSGAGYVGALGSRRTHADRLRRLREAGVRGEELERLASPCGLDIGGRTPAETAVSVLAEIIARRNGRPGLPLGETSGDIHPRGATVASR